MRSKTSSVCLVAAGAMLGVASALEEATTGFDVGISTDGLWLALAFVCGARATGPLEGSAAGAGALTAANIAYYAAGGTAPHVLAWFVLGVAGGGVFGYAGWFWRSSDEVVRVGAALVLAGVLIVEGSEVWRATREPDHAIELTIGLVLAGASARTNGGLALACAATLVVAAIAATGVLDPLLP